MSRHTVLAAGTFLLASTIAASAGGIGFGITIGPGAFGPGFHSAPPPREYHPRVRSYREEPSRPQRQHRQNADDDAKAAETTAPAKSQENENSSIAALSVKPGEPDLHGENSSIAGGPRPAQPAPSATVTVQLENSSIAAAPRPAEPAPAPVAVQAESPVEQAVSSHPALCSRYYPTAGRTVQGPCE
jgi:hypothetical protein